VDELLETLKDPRFNVRFEAVISIARMPPDPRLTDALVEILHGTELALTVIAAWALGRIGDVNAIGPLRQGLDSDYRSVRAACARALGALGDLDVAPELLARLQRETDKGLQMAYASALGNLHYTAATETLLALLRDTQNEGARMELALTLARLIGDEHHFVQLVRSVRADPGTATAQALNSVKRRLERNLNENTDVLRLLVDCTESLARANLDKGGSLLSNLIRALPTEQFSPPSLLILEECAARLDEYHAQHLEYLLLALHTMHAGWK
jgi:HEAT repeat protein